MLSFSHDFVCEDRSVGCPFLKSWCFSLSLSLSVGNKCAKGINRPKEGSIRNLQFVRWRVFFSCLGHGAWSTYLVHCRWVPTLLTFLGNQAVSGFKWTMRPTGTNFGRWRNGQKFIESMKERKVQSLRELFDEVHRHDTLIDRPHTNF